MFGFQCLHRLGIIEWVESGCPGCDEPVPVAKCETEFKFCTPNKLASDDGWRQTATITQRPKSCAGCPIGREQIAAAKRARDESKG